MTEAIDTIPFPDSRTPNRPWARHRSCDLCLDDGLVTVGADPVTGTDQTAPCPECETGFMVEFGYGRRPVTVGQSVKHVLYQRRSPWGSSGYWGRAGAVPIDAAVRASAPADLPEDALVAAAPDDWTEDELVPWNEGEQ